MAGGHNLQVGHASWQIQDVTPLRLWHMLVFVPPLGPRGLEFLKQFIQITLANHLCARGTNFTILNRVNPDPDILSMNDRHRPTIDKNRSLKVPRHALGQLKTE